MLDRSQIARRRPGLEVNKDDRSVFELFTHNTLSEKT